MPGVNSSARAKIRGDLEPASVRNLDFCDFRRIFAETEHCFRTFFFAVAAPFSSHIYFPLTRFLLQARLHHRNRCTRAAGKSTYSCGGAIGVLCCLSLPVVARGHARVFFFLTRHPHPCATRAFQDLSGDRALVVHPRGTRGHPESPRVGTCVSMRARFLYSKASLWCRVGAPGTPPLATKSTGAVGGVGRRKNG